MIRLRSDKLCFFNHMFHKKIDEFSSRGMNGDSPKISEESHLRWLSQDSTPHPQAGRPLQDRPKSLSCFFFGVSPPICGLQHASISVNAISTLAQQMENQTVAIVLRYMTLMFRSSDWSHFAREVVMSRDVLPGFHLSNAYKYFPTHPRFPRCFFNLLQTL